jgi:uncharacterized protein YutE (UPF0331/DUF86 family)
MNDAVLNKKESLERCVKQIRLYYQQAGLPFEKDFMKQDAIAVNLQRICEICIDMANMVIRKGKLGVPKESRESFTILFDNHLINQTMLTHLKAMVGFRNTLVHQYQAIDLSIMKVVVEKYLDELIDFSAIILSYFENS